MPSELKLVHVSRRDEAVRDFLSADLRDRLAAIGVRRVQVNVDDGAVATAQMRTSSEPTPIRAVITTWGEGEPGEVTSVLRDVAADVVGWRVEERIPLAAPEVPDGERAGGYAQVAFLRRPADLSREEWLHRWLGLHTRVAIDTQGTFGYVQNIVEESFGEAGAPVAGIVEELFPAEAMTDWHAFFGSGGDDAELARRMEAMGESVSRFGGHDGIEVIATSRYTYRL